MGTMQANSETNPEVMKASIIQELGKEQVVAVAAYYNYLQAILHNFKKVGLEEANLAMVTEQKPLKCQKKGGICNALGGSDCCPGLGCVPGYPIGTGYCY